MPLASLPSDHGIGDLVSSSFKFIDFLSDSGVDCWQLLPLVPLGKGNSPYYSVSCYAGEPLYIDLKELAKDGLLSISDIDYKYNKDYIDYDEVREKKYYYLFKAFKSFDSENRDFIKFQKENEFWLEDYAVFCTAAEEYGHLKYFDDGLKYRLFDRLNEFKALNSEKIKFYKVLQYFFYRQFFKMKAYAEKRGITLIGDIPFYISDNSTELWQNPQYFKLERDLTPSFIAGVPPDIFSKTGQLWGNPVYDFEIMKKDGYLWWKNRIEHQKKLYDIIRIDHFRAFANYYEISATEETALNGKWVSGPAEDFFKTLNKSIKLPPIIAEDLGGEDDKDVQRLLKNTGYPGMKVLEFCFEKINDPKSVPKSFPYNCVCYTGTHDNDTVAGWFSKLSAKEKVLAGRYIDINSSVPVSEQVIKYANSLNIKMVIIPLSDYLNLDSKARINTPGTPKGNWIWRANGEYLSKLVSDKIKRLINRK